MWTNQGIPEYIVYLSIVIHVLLFEKESKETPLTNINFVKQL